MGTLNRFWATWAITMFVLSPSVQTTTASASSMPASISTSRSRPWPCTNCPGQSSGQALKRLGVLVDDGHLVPFGCHA